MESHSRYSSAERSCACSYLISALCTAMVDTTPWIAALKVVGGLASTVQHKACRKGRAPQSQSMSEPHGDGRDYLVWQGHRMGVTEQHHCHNV